MATQELTEILDYAIAREQEAHDFYAGLAGKMDRPEMRDVFLQFSKEELGHKARLEGVKMGRTAVPPSAKVMDLRIADYVVDVREDPRMSYQDALILAMKREKASFHLYTDLAHAVGEPSLKDLFSSLAMEEAKHKLRFELEYDERYLPEN
jgi:rubrerythrin